MAKKRKRQEEKKEEREYKPPKFDRKEFVMTEVGVSKATIIAALFSIPMGLVAMFVMPVGGFSGGILAGLAGIGIIWVLIPKTGIDVAPFKPMQWVGVMSTYFLVFLAVWVMLCNPPFNDLASPEIRKVQVMWDGGSANVTASGLGSFEAHIPANVTDITVRAQVTDNTAVDINTVRIAWGEQSGQTMTQTSNVILFESTISNVTQFQTFTITASDTNGNAHDGYAFTLKHLP
ncbi:MAG: hypothetical protein R6W91_05965 [Thermoplasmata archaeon]